jgi:hypothetical protein
MPTKAFHCEASDIIQYGNSKYLVLDAWSNGQPKRLMNCHDNIEIFNNTPSGWEDINFKLVAKGTPSHKYWKVCNKIQEMYTKRKEQGYAF